MKKRTLLTLSFVPLFGIVSSPVAQADLVSYWNFDENTGTQALDFSANKNDATRGGSSQPAWVTNGGNAGAGGDNALSFGGTTSYLSVPNSSSFGTITNKFTFASWLYETANTNYGHIMVTSNNGSNRNWLWQTENSGGGDQAYVWSSTNAAWQKAMGYTNPNNAWNHYTYTYDGTLANNQLKVYLNGSATPLQQRTVTSGTLFPSFSGGSLYLGGWLAGNSGFNGKLDDMVMFNSVESAASIYNGTNSGLLGYWTAGGSGPTYDWNVDANWGGARPSDRRAMIFDTSNGLTTNNNNFAANSKFAGITFRSSAGAFTLSGNAVNLTGDVTNNSTATQTISLTGGLVLDGGTRTFNTASGDIVVSNGISQANGTNGLVKSGNGILTLAGSSSYGGTTAVNAGTLLANGSLTGSGAVTVGASGKLGGTGSITGSVSVAGIFSPGASIESLSTGALTMTSGSSFVFEASNGSPTGADLTVVNGALSLTSVSLDLSGANLSAGSWNLGDKLTLISYTGSAITSGFTGYADDQNYLFGSNIWNLNYDDSAKGNNFSSEATGSQFVTLTVVPEPTSLALGAVGLLMVLRRRRVG